MFKVDWEKRAERYLNETEKKKGAASQDPTVEKAE
jgi:hypothetical protein